MVKRIFVAAPLLRTAMAVSLSLILLAVCAAAVFAPPFGKWTRLVSPPILSPQGNGFESAGTFNPAVVKKDGRFVMLYRAQDHQGTSSLGYATSDDGMHFNRQPTPVLTAEAPYEKGGGVEDPRLQKFGDTYYLTYTGYNNIDGVGSDKKDAQLCLPPRICFIGSAKGSSFPPTRENGM
jgi:hypothetical protein